MGREKIHFFDVCDEYGFERGNVWNQYLVSAVLVCLYALTKVFCQIWGPILPDPPGRGYGDSFLQLWVVGKTNVK